MREIVLERLQLFSGDQLLLVQVPICSMYDLVFLCRVVVTENLMLCT